MKGVQTMQKETEKIDVWLRSNLKYTDLKETIERALKFYGQNYEKMLIESDLILLLNDKRQRNTLGRFNSLEMQITLFRVRESLEKNILDCVFVHEMAHFIDNFNRRANSRYNYASSQPGTKERIIAELFRMKMEPVLKKRTNYRGRTCELFARAIEEFYAISTKNEGWKERFLENDYYVNEFIFRREIYSVIAGYIKELKNNPFP